MLKISEEPAAALRRKLGLKKSCTDVLEKLFSSFAYCHDMLMLRTTQCGIASALDGI
jgi:hypothetical protein